jgi:AcrR family transcriptional regulator
MPQKRGPKRSEATRLAILHATADELGTRGYENLSIEGIAARAGVGKSTIYRWWPSKGAVIAECLTEGIIASPVYAPSDTGDLRADLARWLGEAIALIEEPENLALYRSLLSASSENPAVAQELGDVLGAAEALGARLIAGRDSGQLAADQPIEPIVHAVMGTLIVRILSADAASPGLAEDIAAALIP